jgi:hypothetical protein
MFDTPDTKGESSGLGKWVGILVILALIGGGVVFFLGKKDAAPNAASSTASSAAAAPSPQTNADAVKDLRIVSQKLDKDSSDAAMWSVELRNLSHVYTYSNIQYETTYIGRDGSGLGDNKGTIPQLSLDPGDSQTTQFRDTLYPSGTALFKIKILGATATQ